ncbi:MAG: hypothetical protein DMF15_06050 [Verrucomicrobia bacterium]|nr:MAG: hypothetical protein DMF15_06050 [Verrucomicrobiota bacterium]
MALARRSGSVHFFEIRIVLRCVHDSESCSRALVVTYQATDAVLTATKNAPDQGSTLLLLTLSFLGLLMCRCRFLRKQA